MKKLDLPPVIEDALLKQTEEALKEFAMCAHNAGMKKFQIAVMFRKIADEYAPQLAEGQLLQ